MATNLTVDRGNTLILNLTFSDSAGSTTILSGATVYFTVKSSPGYDSTANDSTALWTLSSTGNTGNTCTLTSSAANTWVSPATYYYDVTIAFSDGTVTTPVTGTLKIVGIPTNRAS